MTTSEDLNKCFKNSGTEMRQEDTMSLVKSIITSEFRELKRDLNINTVNSKSTSLKRKYSDDTCGIKYTGNKKTKKKNNSISMFQY